jgi:hypothetical protein
MSLLSPKLLNRTTTTLAGYTKRSSDSTPKCQMPSGKDSNSVTAIQRLTWFYLFCPFNQVAGLASGRDVRGIKFRIAYRVTPLSMVAPKRSVCQVGATSWDETPPAVLLLVPFAFNWV